MKDHECKYVIFEKISENEAKNGRGFLGQYKSKCKICKEEQTFWNLPEKSDS